MNKVFLGIAAAGFLAFWISFLVCMLIRRIAPSLGLLDRPGERKIHSVPIPVGGGFGIWCGVLIPIAGLVTGSLLMIRGTPIPFFGDFSSHAEGILHSSDRLGILLSIGTVLFLLGTLDDRFGLNWKIRLGIEVVAAAATVFCGWEATFFVKLPLLTKLVSVIWIVGLINSFNLLDNMDGLSSGVAAICAFFLAVVFLFCVPNPESGDPQLFLGGFLVLLIGAILGFWFHNMPKARLFMGDGGAYFVGYLLAVITLSATFVGKQNPPQAILTPLCIFAVPLYDTASVVIIRLAQGKSPFEGDTNHYSHRLVAIGLSKTGAVLTIYLTTAICGIGSIFLYYVSRNLACLVGIQLGMVLLLNAILEFTARAKLKKK